MVHRHSVPTIMSIRLLGPRLMADRFRGAHRNLSVIMAHAPHGKAITEDLTAFYTAVSKALDDCNEMDAKVVLIDANTGPGA